MISQLTTSVTYDMFIEEHDYNFSPLETQLYGTELVNESLLMN